MHYAKQRPAFFLLSLSESAPSEVADVSAPEPFRFRPLADWLTSFCLILRLASSHPRIDQHDHTLQAQVPAQSHRRGVSTMAVTTPNDASSASTDSTASSGFFQSMMQAIGDMIPTAKADEGEEEGKEEEGGDDGGAEEEEEEEEEPEDVSRAGFAGSSNLGRDLTCTSSAHRRHQRSEKVRNRRAGVS